MSLGGITSNRCIVCKNVFFNYQRNTKGRFFVRSTIIQQLWPIMMKTLEKDLSYYKLSIFMQFSLMMINNDCLNHVNYMYSTPTSVCDQKHNIRESPHKTVYLFSIKILPFFNKWMNKYHKIINKITHLISSSSLLKPKIKWCAFKTLFIYLLLFSYSSLYCLVFLRLPSNIRYPPSIHSSIRFFGCVVFVIHHNFPAYYKITVDLLMGIPSHRKIGCSDGFGRYIGFCFH